MSDISVYITSDLTSSERKISPQWDISYFKKRLEQITGIEPKFQTLLYYPVPTSNEYVTLSDANSYDEQKDGSTHVGSLNIVTYGRIHIIDTNPNSDLNALKDDDGNEVGFQLTEEEYSRRDGTVLDWKRKQRLGRFDPGYNEIKVRALEKDAKVVSDMKVGDRCRVINIQGERRGTVRFIGKVDILDNGEGQWVGVEYDEPVGKNDGTVEGVKLFDCKKNHGSLLRPKMVEVGDFPEFDPFASDSEEDEI